MCQATLSPQRNVQIVNQIVYTSNGWVMLNYQLCARVAHQGDKVTKGHRQTLPLPGRRSMKDARKNGYIHERFSVLALLLCYWLLGSFWTLFARYCWPGVKFPAKALQHSGCQQFVSFKEVITTFCYRFQFLLDGIPITLSLIAPFVGSDGVVSPLRWTSTYLCTLLHGNTRWSSRQFFIFLVWTV